MVKQSSRSLNELKNLCNHLIFRWKKKKIYRQNIFLQVLSFIASKNNTLRRFVNTLSDRLVRNGSVFFVEVFGSQPWIHTRTFSLSYYDFCFKAKMQPSISRLLISYSCRCSSQSRFKTDLYWKSEIKTGTGWPTRIRTKKWPNHKNHDWFWNVQHLMGVKLSWF